MKNFPRKRKTLYLTLAVMFVMLSLPRTVLSQAATTTTNDFIDSFRREFVPCANGGAGEIVEVSGILHLQAHVTITPKWSIAQFHFQTQVLRGVGLTSGDEYQGGGVNQFSTLNPRTGETFTHTFVGNFHLNSPGSSKHLRIHQTVHMTINANGDVTSTVGNSNIDCK